MTLLITSTKPMELSDRHPDIFSKVGPRRFDIHSLEHLVRLEDIPVETRDKGIELGLQVFGCRAIGFNRQVLTPEPAIGEMLLIGFRFPGENVLDHITHIRNHFNKHDHFIEMSQIIGRQQSNRVDIGAL